MVKRINIASEFSLYLLYCIWFLYLNRGQVWRTVFTKYFDAFLETCLKKLAQGRLSMYHLYFIVVWKACRQIFSILWCLNSISVRYVLNETWTSAGLFILIYCNFRANSVFFFNFLAELQAPELPAIPTKVCKNNLIHVRWKLSRL